MPVNLVAFAALLTGATFADTSSAIAEGASTVALWPRGAERRSAKAVNRYGDRAAAPPETRRPCTGVRSPGRRAEPRRLAAQTTLTDPKLFKP